MTNTWQTYQMQLARLFGQQPIPVPIWRPGRRVTFTPRAPTPSPRDGHDESATPVVRLPGIRRPECSPLMVRIY